MNNEISTINNDIKDLSSSIKYRADLYKRSIKLAESRINTISEYLKNTVITEKKICSKNKCYIVKLELTPEKELRIYPKIKIEVKKDSTDTDITQMQPSNTFGFISDTDYYTKLIIDTSMILINKGIDIMKLDKNKIRVHFKPCALDQFKDNSCTIYQIDNRSDGYD
ncbi:MAG: hypothetical protein ACP5RI_04050, partial [Candidatus Micrarchaeia archaeon]